MGVNVDASELRSLERGMITFGVRVGSSAATVVRKVATDIQARAQSIAPVDTGNLRSTITTTFEGDGRSRAMFADIGPTAEYGKYVELGTSRMAPQPYMRPALDSNIPSFDAAIDAVIGRIDL